MRILIISDTHRYHEPLEGILKNDGPFDLLIHCGDLEGEEDQIDRLTGPTCACVMVPGNNDFFCTLPRERVLKIAGLKILVTHGHNYYVSMDPSILKSEAYDRGMDIVMFGHTHKPLIDESGPVIAINPGSLTYPRQNGRRPSYIVMEAEEGRAPSFEIRYL
ncbi:MAG: metallophosphoesterase [Lachnospiraceae bacterium]|nr:metallophosphoesterase [Lachnospiraceae bacterium]